MGAKDDKIQQLLARISQLEEAAATDKLNFSTELDSQRKLVDLYKRYFDEASQKVEEVEAMNRSAKEAHTALVSQLQVRLKTQEEQSNEVMEKIRADAATTIRELESRLAQQEEMASSAVVAGSRSSLSGLPEGVEGLGMTEMYDRVVEAQRELNVERGKRKEAELYLSRIIRDIDSKTPVILSQRREFMRLMDSHAQLSQQLDDAIVEGTRLRNSLKTEAIKARAAEKELSSLQQQNSDLSQQVQHLLRRQMELSYGSGGQRVALIGFDESSSSSTSSASDVISERLVTFEDIGELQTRNMQLLQVVRKLSEEQEQSLGEAGGAGDLQASLQQAVEELGAMREARQRTEELVTSLVQQRDMYRAIAEDTSSGGARSRLSFESQLSPAKSTSELEMKLARLEEDNRRVVERCGRLEEAEKAASEAVDKLRTESLSLRLEAARSSSNASFQKERCSQLEDALKGVRQEAELASQKRSELQALLISFQKDCRSKDDSIQQHLDQLRAANETIRRYEIDLEVTKKSEERLMTQVTELKEDYRKQASVSDSLRKIEQGLVGQKESQLASVIRERDALLRAVEGLRKELADSVLLTEQKSAALDSELRILRGRLDSKTSECALLREELVRDQTALEAGRERNALLEKQLARAQEQVSASSGGLIDTGSAAAELALEKACAEVESLSQQLRSAEDHVEQFKRISATNEVILQEMRTKHEEHVKTLEEELARNISELESARKELQERRTESFSFMQALETARNDLQSAIKNAEEEARRQAELTSLADENVSALRQELDVLHADVVKYQLLAKEAQDNYRREVTMHSKTSEDLFAVQKQFEEAKGEAAASSRTITELSATIFRLENTVQEERKGHANEIRDSLAKVSDLQATNTLLHNQLQSLGTQITRLQENRVLSSTSTESQISSGDEEDLNMLRTAASELREVIRFMKREQEVTEAKLSIADSEGNRLRVTVASLQRALDETKAELTREMEKRIIGRGDEDFNRLMAEVNQLNMVRESNAHLRAENEELTKRALRLQTELTTAMDRETPLQESIRVLTAEKNAIDNERAALAVDVTYWKDRLHQLVSRYNEVDPEEHRLLLVRVEESKAKLAEMELTVQQNAKEISALRLKESELIQELVLYILLKSGNLFFMLFRF